MNKRWNWHAMFVSVVLPSSAEVLVCCGRFLVVQISATVVLKPPAEQHGFKPLFWPKKKKKKLKKILWLPQKKQGISAVHKREPGVCKACSDVSRGDGSLVALARRETAKTHGAITSRCPGRTVQPYCSVLRPHRCCWTLLVLSDFLGVCWDRLLLWPW